MELFGLIFVMIGVPPQFENLLLYGSALFKNWCDWPTLWYLRIADGEIPLLELSDFA